MGRYTFMKRFSINSFFPRSHFFPRDFLREISFMAQPQLTHITHFALVTSLVMLFFTNSAAQARQNTMSGGTSAPAATNAAPTTTQTSAPTATTTGATAGTPAAMPTAGTAPGTAATQSSFAGEGNILINASVAPAAALSTNATTAAPGFGYGNFRPGTEQITEGPIDNQFVLSPGDEIIVSIWGAMVEKFNLVISDEGFIDLPNEGGRIPTNGVTLKDLRPVIIQQLSQIYSAYINATDTNKSTAFVDVRLGKVRKLLVYVVGEVNVPGAYLISAGMANVLNVLNNAGGIRERGTLREIKIRRNDGTTQVIDLYRFFLNGDIDLNAVRLQPNDYIIVPLKKKSVTISGEVRRPMNYELTNNEGMKELLVFAGGFTSDAYLKQAQIRRFEPNLGELYLDVDLNTIEKNADKNIALVDGDSINIRRNVQVRKNTVTISGDGILRPGTYEWKPGMTMKDLIDKGEGLREYAYVERADLVRTADDFSKTLTIFSLGDLYKKDTTGTFQFTNNADKNFPLREMDQVFVQSAFGMTGADQYVTLAGHVKDPGKFVLAKNMTLYDLIFVRGGFQDAAFTKAAYMDTAHIIRKVPSTVGERIIPFNLGALLANDPTANIPLEENDVIKLYSFADLAMKRSVSIDGLVKKPGSYPMAENLTLEDLLVLAGGLRPEAYKVEAVIARTEVDGARGGEADRTYPTFVVPIQSGYVATPQDKKTLLKAFDRITVRNVLGWEPLDVVLIQGEVLYPGNYSMATKDETISSLIKKAGGLRKEALPEGAMVKRNRNVLNLAPETPAPTYEITINLAQALKNPKGAEDIVLKDGDQIFIPTNPGTIEVKGAVKRALTLQYKDGQTLDDYITLCGGYLDKADKSKVMVYAANNAAQSVSAKTAPVISAGSTIEVPLIKESEWLQTVEMNGAVLKPARMQYIEGARLGYYLNLCGGFSSNADINKIVVHMPDGGLLTKNANEPFNPELPAGSLVVIMTKPNIEIK
jgi:polysaccharide biosynthesis/export protein